MFWPRFRAIRRSSGVRSRHRGLPRQYPAREFQAVRGAGGVVERKIPSGSPSAGRRPARARSMAGSSRESIRSSSSVSTRHVRAAGKRYRDRRYRIVSRRSRSHAFHLPASRHRRCRCVAAERTPGAAGDRIPSSWRPRHPGAAMLRRFRSFASERARRAGEEPLRPASREAGGRFAGAARHRSCVGSRGIDGGRAEFQSARTSAAFRAARRQRGEARCAGAPGDRSRRPAASFQRQAGGAISMRCCSRGRDAFRGLLLICDTTIWSSTAGGLDSLQRFWRNVVTLKRA